MLKIKKTLAFAGIISTILISLTFVQAHTEQISGVAETKENSETSQAQEGADLIDVPKLSETFGNYIGRNLNSTGIKFDVESLIKGIRDGAAGKPAPMNEHEYETMMAKFQQKAFKEMSEQNLKAANEFLAKNAKEANVKEIESGKLQYSILKEGTGTAVTEKSSPQINYTGKYLDGNVFGSSEESGGPITIPLDQTIPGFSKGIIGMKEGEKRRLFVHPDLAYGTSGQLPPNSLLIFDIELIKADNKQAKGKEEGKDNPTLSMVDETQPNEDDDSDDGDDDHHLNQGHY